MTDIIAEYKQLSTEWQTYIEDLEGEIEHLHTLIPSTTQTWIQTGFVFAVGFLLGSVHWL